MTYNQDLVQRALGQRYFEKMLRHFLIFHGDRILEEWYSESSWTLRTPTDLFIVGAGEAAQFAYECEILFRDAMRFLGGTDREWVCRSSFEAAAHAIAAANHDAPVPDESVVQIKKAESYLNRAANRRSNITYLWGMLLGFPILALLGFVAYLGLSKANLSYLDADSLLVTMGAGAVGAIVSVLTRVTRGTLNVDYEAGLKLLLIFGAFRPIVGCVFGVLVYLLKVGGLLPIASPDSQASAGAFLAVVAFAAGFSERLAQDMLTKAGVLSNTA